MVVAITYKLLSVKETIAMQIAEKTTLTVEKSV